MFSALLLTAHFYFLPCTNQEAKRIIFLELIVVYYFNRKFWEKFVYSNEPKAQLSESKELIPRFEPKDNTRPTMSENSFNTYFAN